ncbi:recombinase family protein [Acutalibacter muris]|uniref:recombinase family protein n=1 Tax=Acutalibacter muris TaxID=1796620 RepID=UPI001C3E8F81|nr:recombinase family protein [Acutalibacter muris]
MRAWLFCRVANGWDSDARDYLALQKAELEHFCNEHDLTVVGTTDTTGNGKDELKALVRNGIEQDSFDVLVAISASRFGRDVFEILQHCQELGDNGKGMCFVKESLCTLPGVITEQSTDTADLHEMGGQSL